MIKLLKKSSLNYVVPQAIFWRPIAYFAIEVRAETDELDDYEVATYSIGNKATFDLRHYAGHPRFTVSLYLPFDMKDEAEIVGCIDTIVEAFALPTTAVAWKRGADFVYGRLERPPADRLREPEARILALKIAATRRERVATTTEIKSLAGHYFAPSAKDLEKSRKRNEPLWKQIVGNVISHHGSRLGPFAQGYAQRTRDGLKVTPAGLAYLNSIGFTT